MVFGREMMFRPSSRSRFAVFVVPFVMFGAAFLLYEMHRLLPLALGPAGVPLARGVRAFSLVTLFGAVLLLFF